MSPWEVTREVLLMWGVLVAVNVPAAAIGLDFDDGPRRPGDPPGWLVTSAWIVLFACLGIARARLDGSPAAAVLWLAVLCATYAWYTIGLARLTGVSPLWLGLVGNLVVITAAATLAAVVAAHDRTAAVLVATVVPWTAYATLVIVRQLREAPGSRWPGARRR